jgi:hypothetical protein
MFVKDKYFIYLCNMIKINKIVSGGQFGSDLGGLEAAKVLGLATGGFAPQNFMTENGSQKELLSSYGLKEAGFDPKVYPKRTMLNVDFSDGTLAVRPSASIGTDCTIGYAKTKRWGKAKDFSTTTNYKPVFVLTSFDLTDDVIAAFKKWVNDNNIQTLNVAGSRESKKVGTQAKTRDVIIKLINNL